MTRITFDPASTAFQEKYAEFAKAHSSIVATGVPYTNTRTLIAAFLHQFDETPKAAERFETTETNRVFAARHIKTGSITKFGKVFDAHYKAANALNDLYHDDPKYLLEGNKAWSNIFDIVEINP